MMPGNPGEVETELAIDEETRVLFVAATRARQQLRISSGDSSSPGKKVNGRAYRFDYWNGSPKCDFELGRAGDLTAIGLAGRSFFADQATVLANQKKWIELVSSGAAVEAYKWKVEEEWRFSISTKYNAPILAVLSGHIDDDLYEATCLAVSHFKLDGTPRKPRKLSPIHVLGLTTLAIGADDPEAGALIEPWRSTGLILLPSFTACHGSPLRPAED